MKQILDLHIHSKYSRACSRDLELPNIARTCEIRGIDIVTTGDFTHPAWFSHMKDILVEDGEGVYKLRDNSSKTKFVIGTEIAFVKKHKDKTRRLHLLIFAPSLDVAEKFNKVLSDRGFNLKSDGRPILGMCAKDILALMLETDERMVMIPAHAWTPWFGVFGSKGGYDSLEDCFEDLTPHIFAIETGLSSDPLMNWRLSSLDKIALISNSDAHSLGKLGREANVFDFPDKISYAEMMRIIREKKSREFLHTVEFYPEEGKYYADGHKDCGFYCLPSETKKLKGLCPKCKRPLVVGVLNRVNELADRTEAQTLRLASLTPGKQKFIPYKSLVPLPEILADVYDVGVNTKTVKIEYDNMIAKCGNEFHILLSADLKMIEAASNKKIAKAIGRVRNGQINIRPGYDGEFGAIKIF